MNPIPFTCRYEVAPDEAKKVFAWMDKEYADRLKRQTLMRDRMNADLRKRKDAEWPEVRRFYDEIILKALRA
jgi:hypothetical protein